MSTSSSIAAPDRPARLHVDEVGHCLVAAVRGGDRADARAVAKRVPAEEDRIAVVMSRLTSALVPALLQQLRPWVPIRWDSVRLVAAGASHRDGRPPAQELADGLGVEVIAADGDLLCLPDGSLFVAASNGHGRPEADHRPAGRGSWWRFRPGREPQQLGRRFPEPEWERHLDQIPPSQLGPGGGVVVEDVPCGLWLHRPGPVDPDDLIFAVPMHHADAALVVSRPGERPLAAAEVRQLVAALPTALRERLVLAPYGDRPVADGRLGEIGSEAANQTLRVRTGLPLQLFGEGRHVVAVRRDGVPGWRPFAVELAWRPYGGARVHKWTTPGDNLLPLGPAQLALNDRWMVEVVEAGLWIHTIDRVDGATAVRELPLDADYCTVVVGGPDAPQDRPPWRAVVRLLRSLPVDARSSLRIAVADDAGARMVRAAAKVQERLTDGQIWLLRTTGRERGLVPFSELPEAGEAVEPDDGDPFPGAPADRDLAGLLSFVEALRRTPSWDEPDGPSSGGAPPPRPNLRPVPAEQRWWWAEEHPPPAGSRPPGVPAGDVAIAVPDDIARSARPGSDEAAARPRDRPSGSAADTRTERARSRWRPGSAP
ncbi:hypothetical protein KZZ52_15275 [Dactylosporangium sp. AC04546]|uniref:hypothetical protein n=1 Tax=Dactylosporangium sp. AC04546 TaxID=2862460 RepID=UPI001EDCE7C6|nr:hypothetical protein [Dactylosporangium sp. AC04546]WVK86668.1 hypothetical protein KZZ52_15275 [Dactylosporangium sp. AC04546]